MQNGNKNSKTYDYGEIAVRIEDLRETLGYKKKKAFCRAIGFPESTYGGITGSRGAKPNVDLLALIVEKHPNVNISWILTGTGYKLLDEALIGIEEKIVVISKEVGIGEVNFREFIGCGHNNLLRIQQTK